MFLNLSLNLNLSIPAKSLLDRVFFRQLSKSYISPAFITIIIISRILPLLNKNKVIKYSKVYAVIPRFWQKTPTCPADISSVPSSEKSRCNFSR